LRPAHDAAQIAGAYAGFVTENSRSAVASQRMVPSLREIAPKILLAGLLPFIGYSALRPRVHSDATALAVVMVFPLADIVIERIRRGRFEPIGMIALFGIVLGLVGAVVFHGNAMLLKLRESVFTGAFGFVCLASLLAARPAMFYLARAFATGGEPNAIEDFNSIWHRPGAARRFKKVTAVWVVGLLAEAVVRTILAYQLPTSQFLAVTPPLGWGVIGLLVWYSIRQRRAGEAQALRASAAAQTSDS